MTFTVYHWLNLKTFDSNCDNQNIKQVILYIKHVMIFELYSQTRKLIYYTRTT